MTPGAPYRHVTSFNLVCTADLPSAACSPGLHNPTCAAAQRAMEPYQVEQAARSPGAPTDVEQRFAGYRARVERLSRKSLLLEAAHRLMSYAEMIHEAEHADAWSRCVSCVTAEAIVDRLRAEAARSAPS